MPDAAPDAAPDVTTDVLRAGGSAFTEQAPDFLRGQRHLADRGVRHVEMPLTAEKVWRLLGERTSAGT